MSVLQKFQKPPLGRQKLIDLMIARGLSLPTIEHQSRARDAISRIGYYRLTGYMPIFQVGGHGPNKHDFLQGVTLEQILSLYSFDTQVRAHLSTGLELIEVAFRTSICDHMCRSTQNSHWMLDSNNFRERTHSRNLEEFKDAALSTGTKSDSITNYFNKYDDPFLPPAWVLRESISFGTWSRLYNDLEAKDQKSVSDDWLYPGTKDRIDHTLLIKWIRALVILRNTCAHHSRVTNRTFSFPPEASKHAAVKQLFNEIETDLRTLIAIISILIKIVKPKSVWLRQLNILFETHSRSVDVARSTGFSPNWRNDVIWDY